MENQKKVSVVMATYNGEEYIREQLDSIITQTYPIYELIIQDDCSTDSTVSICREYEAKYPFIHVFVNEDNLGFKRNFQCAVMACKEPDFIALSDQDDIWTVDHLKHLVKIIGDKPLACADSTLVDSDAKPLGMTLSQQQSFGRLASDDTMKASTILLWRNPYQGSTMLVRKDLLKKALPFPEVVNFHDTWFAILSCFCGGIAYSRHSISLYRMHGNNASGSKVKKMSRRGAITARILGLKSDDRIPMIKAIEERTDCLSCKEKKFLNDMMRYFSNDGIIQKISNAFYLLIHFRSIFTI